jgi:hypothetical protein
MMQPAPRYGHDDHTPSHCLDGNTFDPAAWFAAWSDSGGIAMLIGDRLWIGAGPGAGRESLQALEGLRGYLRTQDASNALAGLLRANAGGFV